ncbi:hypothetical protein SAMD00023353_7700240 [Rosellinia necatrix]|uniref:Uncharacterized protein n=1 Tax=Rosellinia necatrix TaxID=77044 RepID=A0A1W2TU76_ROSNE|nr:hypothetical protein SAMD00023353_7700240 [Rosellinia necatrix]
MYRLSIIFGIVIGSLLDSLVMTSFYITLLPALLRAWWGPLAMRSGCALVLFALLADSGPRLAFFGSDLRRRRSRRHHHAAALLFASALTAAALYLEILCLASAAASGHPVCECYLLACFAVSAAARMLYRFAGGRRIAYGEW